MSPYTCESKGGGRARRLGQLALVVGGLFMVGSLAAQTCPGDCGGDRVVTVDELLRCVNIALGSSAVDDCPPCDDNQDGTVTIDELIREVNAALVGCTALIAADGNCMRPGPDGLVACAPGTVVRASRCDDRRICLDDDAGSTLLSSGTVGNDGGFAMMVDADKAGSAALVIEADVEVDTGATYRIIDFGFVGSRAGSRSEDVGQGHAATLDDLRIDPVSEAGVRLLAEAGLEKFADDAIVEIIETARVANAGMTFAGASAADAATIATQTAEADPVVQETIQNREMTLVNIAGEGRPQPSSIFSLQFGADKAVDGDRRTSWFSDGAAGGPDETYRWTGVQDEVIVSLAVLSNAFHANPAFRAFGFGSVRIQVLAASGATIFDVTRDLPGSLDPDIEVFPNVRGRSVLLTFHDHDDPSCGGFSELQVVTRRALGF
ncbi:MAG: hypothetical protein ACE5I7_18350 [Candidatus Binatia bacterium]